MLTFARSLGLRAYAVRARKVEASAFMHGFWDGGLGQNLEVLFEEIDLLLHVGL